jgi:hypothetical protein
MKGGIQMNSINRLLTQILMPLFSFFCWNTEASELRIEGENMFLVGYEVAKSDTAEYIKLSGKTGVASFEFCLPSGEYDIDARYLSEKKGQNTYALYIGDNQIIAWLGKDRDEQWHMVSEQRWHNPRRIHINKGDKIKIESLSDQGSLAILDYVEFKTSSPLNSTTQQGLATIHPDEYEHAFRNPLKGFRPTLKNDAAMDTDGSYFSTARMKNEYGTLSKMYFRWNDLESESGDTVEKIKDICDVKWLGIEKENHKIIPRVYLAWPRKASGWPSDITNGDVTSNQFKQRVVALIKKLAAAWDNDSRVAFVEMGLIGEWGEMEWPDTTDEIKGMISAQFAASFTNKLVMIRWPNTYNDDKYNFGYYWDSFAHQDQEYYAYRLKNTTPRWKTAVIGGETAYNWGNADIQPGKSPDESLKNPVHRTFVIDHVRTLHANHVGWIANYSQDNEGVRAGADLVQKALGYRFVISEITYPKKVALGDPCCISFKVKNTGSSPFYYNWPLEVSLLDPKTKEVVWKQKCHDVDIRKWMPGDEWDKAAQGYRTPAEDNLVNQTLKISGIPEGEYFLSLAILDPAGDRPCVRFAIKNYYKGGRHPMGRVGVNRTIDSFNLSGFDDIQGDRSLSYDKVVK